MPKKAPIHGHEYLTKRGSFYVFFAALYLSVFVAGVPVRAEGSLKITVSTDRDTVNIGDNIELKIEAENVSGREVVFPDTPENLGDFVLRGSRSLSGSKQDGGRTGHVYILSVYDTGTHVIPPVTVKYRSPGNDEWQTRDSSQVPIEVESLLTEESSEIRDIKGLLPFVDMFKRIILIFCIFLAALTVFLLMRRYRSGNNSSEPEAPPVPAHITAYNELNALKAMDLPGKGLVEEYYTRLSGILRRYLENRFSFRAVEMTTEEFLEVAKYSPLLAAEHKHSLEAFLSHCDMVKFAKYGPTKLEMIDSFDLAERFVGQTAVREEGEV
ncbi:MAG: BatD family protein [Candidatus Omnitrophota bacterium]